MGPRARVGAQWAPAGGDMAAVDGIRTGGVTSIQNGILVNDSTLRAPHARKSARHTRACVRILNPLPNSVNA